MGIERFFDEWDPFRELAQIQRRIGRMLEDAGLPRFERWLAGGAYPPVNVYTTPDEVVVAAELPGVKVQDVDVSVVSGVLTLRGRRPEPADGDVRYIRRERATGEFTRTIALAEQVDHAKARAEYRKGILTVILPRAEEAKPRRIEIRKE